MLGSFSPLYMGSRGEGQTQDLFASNVIMALSMENNGDGITVVDDSFYKNILTRAGNPVISTTQKKFGKSSLYFDGTGDYYHAAQKPIFNQTGDFTIEFWIYPSKYAGWVVSHKTDGNWDEPSIGLPADGRLILDYLKATRIRAAAAIPLNQWTHVSYGYSGNKYFMYVNGVLQGTYVNATKLSGWSLTLGSSGWQRNTGTTDKYTGYMDEFRWWQTVSIRDGVNGFTPPTAPWQKPQAPTSGTLSFTAASNTFELPPQFTKMDIELWGAGGGGSGIATTVPLAGLTANRGSGMSGGSATGGDLNYKGGNGTAGNMQICAGGNGGAAGKINGSYGAGASGTRSWEGSGSDGNCREVTNGSGGGGYCKKSFTRAQLPTSLNLNVGQASGGGGAGLIILTWS